MNVIFFFASLNEICSAIRVYATPGAGGDRVPTKKGVAVNVKIPPKLISVLQDADREARVVGHIK